jgi:hypothetical protein
MDCNTVQFGKSFTPEENILYTSSGWIENKATSQVDLSISVCMFLLPWRRALQILHNNPIVWEFPGYSFRTDVYQYSQWSFITLNATILVRFEVFTAVTMKNGVFWDVTPCGSCKNRRFGGTLHLHHQTDIPKITLGISSQRASVASYS